MFPFLFHPLFWILVGPAILLTLWAQYKVKSAYASASKTKAMSGLTGAQAARELLDLHGLGHVGIERSRGQLSDHYDPRHKVLRLSEGVYDSNSLAALGIAAHEAGHAIQEAKHYAPLKMRNALVPMAITGGQLASWFLIGGIVLMALGAGFGGWLFLAGVGAFALTVVFQLVNLPVEFDASSRAKAALVEYGMVHEQEMDPVRRVLSAAAMTYVAATLVGVMQLLYFVLMIFGGQE